MPQTIYLQYPFNRRMGGPKNQSGHFGEEKKHEPGGFIFPGSL
jgi:hypothetical protein